ncbi:uncharacterized protein K441DRAFT_559275, partial [Cenococcum geophilum 1.58]|uniref:uncharacterized protein n=1 Tax=Cenococcum geophilum 1.58 TaxID=794803 RepID=UPI00358F20F2
IIDNILPSWPGFRPRLNTGFLGNYLAILILGWSYVLSTYFLKLRKKSRKDRIFYTNNKAAVFTTPALSKDSSFSIYIGDIAIYKC